MESNLRVVVRVRPLMEKELAEQARSCLRLEGDARNQIILGDDRAFTFDTVLDTACSHETAYEEACRPLVAPFFDGYNCTIFAYGQTGAGKTYSMNSIIDALLPDVFRRVEGLAADNVGVTIRVSCMEIHNEAVRDLLDIKGEGVPITIRDGVDGNVVVSGVVEHTVRTEAELLEFIRVGTASRTTASTLMNDTSSRSHSIVTLTLEQHAVVDMSETMSETVVSKFRIVDLAGSERAKKTGASGARLKESININSGLLVLGNVIAALCEQQEQPTKRIHVPYRDCKLTRVLQDSLGGNSVTVMLACVSPADSNFEETLNTLKWANRAKNIMNKPIKNRDPHAVAIEKLQADLARALALLAEHRIGFETTTNVSAAPARPLAAAPNASNAALVADIQRENSNLRGLVEMAFELVEGFERSVGAHSDPEADNTSERDLSSLAPRLHLSLRRNAGSAATIAQLNNDKVKLERHVKMLEDDLFRAEYSAMSANNERQKLVEEVDKVMLGQSDGGSAGKDMIETLSKERDVLWKEKVDIESRKCALEMEKAQFDQMQQHQERAVMSMEDEIRKREALIRDMMTRDVETQRAQEAYLKSIERIQEQRDKAKAELAKAMQQLEQRGLTKDVKEREVRRIQQTYESKLRTVEQTLTDMRRKQKDAELQLRSHGAEKERVRKMQHELLALRESCEQAREKARAEAAKSVVQRVTSAQHQQQMMRQLRDIEGDNSRLTAALKIKEEEIVRVKHTVAAAAAAAAKTTPNTSCHVPPSPPLRPARSHYHGHLNPAGSEAEFDGYRKMAELRNRLEKQRGKLEHSCKEREDATRLKEDLQRTISHRKLGDATRVQRSLSGWEFRISSLDKELAVLIALNDPRHFEKIDALQAEKRNAEMRYAEVRTLMPTLENTLSERVREAEDRIDSLTSAVVYHEKNIDALLQEMAALPAAVPPTTAEDEAFMGKSAHAKTLLSKSYQKIMLLSEQDKSKDRTIKQLAQELVEKQRIIESLHNMISGGTKGGQA